MINLWSVVVSNDVDKLDLVRQNKEDALMLARDIAKTNKTHNIEVLHYVMKDSIRVYFYYNLKGELERTVQLDPIS